MSTIFFIFNGAYGIRTHGLLNAIEARSQLRQCPIAADDSKKAPGNKQYFNINMDKCKRFDIFCL